MKGQGFFWVLFLALGLGPVSDVYGGKEYTRCYRVHEESLEQVDQSPYRLCLTSEDLSRFPRSVVTITLTENPADGSNPKVLAKRHYRQFKKGEFGRRIARTDEPQRMLIFNQKESKVYVGFINGTGKTYYFKPLTETPQQQEVSVGQVKHQKLQLGKLDTR